MESLDLHYLGYSPTLGHWRMALGIAGTFGIDSIVKLIELYYPKIWDMRHVYLQVLVDSGRLEVLARADEEIRKDAAEVLISSFENDWDEQPRSLSIDDTWEYIRDLGRKLNTIGFGIENKARAPLGQWYARIRQKAAIDIDTLYSIAGAVSKDSMGFIRALYGDGDDIDIDLSYLINEICEIDSIAVKYGSFSDIVIGIKNMNTPGNWTKVNRMARWHNVKDSPPVEWTLALTVANAEYNLDVEAFLSRRRSIPMRPARPGAYSTDDAIDLFIALNETGSYRQLNDSHFRDRMPNAFLEAFDRIAARDDCVQTFDHFGVMQAFEAIKEPDWKKFVGPRIADQLGRLGASRNTVKVYLSQLHSSQISIMADAGGFISPIPVPVLASCIGIAVVMAIVGLWLATRNGDGIAAYVMDNWIAVWIPYTLSAIVILTTAGSVSRLRKK
jgi:hypothetical protein